MLKLWIMIAALAAAASAAARIDSVRMMASK